ncbi:phosphoadenosine phosphosulfate reductase [Streptacidiphilus anmyonensis]|uniref:phosphoadenosine phosphosulfate reductase n=1 Tax=Streptacidiphilus anmyonensis TaxID=405782 RepID=UPI0005AA5BCA|nr:phosphoadenosine phosphosulfate reductase [Streptacidiphilus anmyonensis]
MPYDTAVSEAWPVGTVTRAPAPDLADYDVISVNLSGGGDSFAAVHELMGAAQAAGVADRVWTFHATLGPADWPDVHDGAGRLHPGAAGMAAAQSLFCGVPAGRHLVGTKLTTGPEPVVYDLLTYTAAYGRFPRLGTRYCTRQFKEAVEEAAFTPVINQLKVTLGLAGAPTAVKLRRPVRRLKVLGLRAEESRARAERPAYRHVHRNGVRHVDEWSPVKAWTKDDVRALHARTGMPHHWTYDSRPGANDWLGTSRCSCSLCFLSARRDLLLGAARRPRYAALIARVEQVRGDTFRPDWSMAQLIEESKRPGAPEPGIVLADETPEFAHLERQVALALAQPPRRLPHLAARLPVLGDGCAATCC